MFSIRSLQQRSNSILTLRRTLMALSAAVTVVIGVAATTSQSAEVFHFTFQEPVAFTLTPEQCSDLQVTVTGSGERMVVVNERIDQNGVDHIVVNDTAQGTATDSEGASYIFNYHNHANVEVQPDGFPVEVKVTDHFNLNGQGKANQTHPGFVLRVLITSPTDEPVVDTVNERGNPVCDPI
jgi:hypothetical protein